MKIWLCDLCYTQQIVSAEVMPTAVGGIATFVEAHVDPSPETLVFKYPEKLLEALEDGPPRILGLSNYCWNFELGYGFAEYFKQRYPDTVVVMGGPNYPIDEPSQEAFMRSFPAVDFYVMKEGEVPFARLVSALTEHDFDLDAVKKMELGGVHALLKDGTFVAPPLMDRLKDLTVIPSPYVTGKLDEFFDGVLMPILQIYRGCPFSCTFCTEGVGYFNKVYQSSQEKIAEEIDYIGARMAASRRAGGRNDLFIADSNFGMLKDDLDTCRLLAKSRKQYEWPEYIKVATGKNRKERVIEASRIIDGALSLSGSVQSLDPEVLVNIKRGNIDAQGLMDLAMEADLLGANSYAEIILALPGDTMVKHLLTIETLIDAGFTNICMFQLMQLPGTELYTPEVRAQYKMQTHYRVLPRCFGNYETSAGNIITAEVEEIVTSTDTLSFEDYVACRRFNLIVTIFFNDAVFRGLLKLLRVLGISRFAWIKKVFDAQLMNGLATLVDGFMAETKNELWESKEELAAFVATPENIKKYLNDELGANLLYKYQALATNEHLEELAEVARTSINEVLSDAGQLTPDIEALVGDIVRHEVLLRIGIFRREYAPRVAEFRYDVGRFLESGDDMPLADFAFDQPQQCRFALDDHQQSTIERSLKAYGTDTVGMTRILARVHVKSLLRHSSVQEEISSRVVKEV